MSKTKKAIYIIVGTISLVLGAIGIFLPLLPTTPFWLLTCWCYLRGSQRLYDYVMANRYFGPYIRNYVVHKAIPIRTKVTALSVMWLSTILTSLFLIENGWMKLGLVLISTAVTWHIVSFPTKKDSKTSLQ
ncbi:YbaN family protein [Massilibacteroides sp.]|uniref:YbaN family protein n=1 Tax=Massilibacteroides sp. TaxID=2034766 RepID=UPI002602BE26|nr:YbaN family protein [Massilibacteroides sp.]MDD4515459.1 YbaN family protein [Massilibacteroides sp.]